MRLDKIKLSGFKSFVDPTTVKFPSNLTGIVGPNGCGKSNIIDAVRWVMGETSAKHLRGDSMADVIFNGSTSRKPVGQASIELIFDNSDGAIGGQYAKYNEISVKRMVSRDGQSNYFLNGARCRRRDITDIFLGTGLGPRSYSIIEQGMISRLIEAKPEELRVYLEEAAGISKYKERRKETETRIRHTRENLERLSDLREEIEKQLEKLNRQAKTAEKYKEFKQQERKLNAELLALKLKGLDQEATAQQKVIQERETALEAAKAKQQSIETSLEKDREAHIEATDVFNEIQGRYYGLGSEIARDEQAIHHTKEMRNKQRHDLAQLEENWRELEAHVVNDTRQIEELSNKLQEIEPELARACEVEQRSQEAQTEAEEKMHQWQREWDEFTQSSSVPSQQAQVERTRIDHLERQIVQNEQRLERNQRELSDVSGQSLEQQIETLEQEEQKSAARLGELQAQLESTLRRIGENRNINRELNDEIDEVRGSLQNTHGRLASLEALQQAALGKSEGAVSEWLERQGLLDAPRLAQKLSVQSGWERAVETVLGQHLEAVCVDGVDALVDVLGQLDQGSLDLFDTRADTSVMASNTQATLLSSKVTAPWSMGSLISGVYTADSLQQAIALRGQLAANESVITAEGIWIGKGWLRVARDVDEKSGVLEREQEINQLRERKEELQQQVDTLQSRLEEGRELVQSLEEQRESIQQDVNQSNRDHAQAQSQLNSVRARSQQIRNRHENLVREAEELRQQLEADGDELKASRTRLNEALEKIESLARVREELIEKRDSLRQVLDHARLQARQDRDEMHRINMLSQSMSNQLSSTQQNLERMERQMEGLQKSREELQESLAGSEDPLKEMEQRLAGLLESRVQVEAELTEARKTLEEIDEAVRRHEQDRVAAEQVVQDVRTSLEQARMGWQEFNIRAKTLQEQLAGTGFALQELLEGLPEDATMEAWQQSVEEMERRIQRLGPINLAAIEEFAEQTERKKYLDEQFADVTEALETLENAIRKIDRETRTRFKETFDKVNNGLKEKFPRVFGGGHAYLELTGEDLLDAGVTVMARPPGKRNSSIHLLSGGEKALTAVALVFAIFELNPAPFCMLDEVDAPLDDANVGRFCEMVKEMSDTVQFIFITHNKVTMAMSNQLAGVTMHEPGVSRIVAVDVDEAVKLAAM